MLTYKNLLITFSTVTVMLLAGCETSSRDLDLEKMRASDDSPAISQTPVSGGDTNSSAITPITETPISDNNDTESVVKVDPKNAYKLSMTLSNDKFQQYEIGILHYDLSELYTATPLDVSIIEKITFSVPDTRYCKFVDFQGKETNRFEITGTQLKPAGDIRVKMGANSGTTEIKVTAVVKLPDGTRKELSNTIPVVVMKNKTASITVNPYGTKWVESGENAGLFVEKFVFHVVDKYGNKAKDGTYVQIGAVVDPKLYTLGYTAGSRIDVTGTLTQTKEFNVDTDRNDISLTKEVFDNEDNLVILPNRTRNDPAYLGGWQIDYITGEHTLKLVDDYTGNPAGNDLYGADDHIEIGDVSGLTFVIGDEDRYNPCSKTLANAAFYFPEGAKVKDGLVYAELRYQPYLVGKTIFVYANAVVNEERIGIAREIHLTGEGLAPQTVSCKNDTNQTVSCTLSATMALNGYKNLARYVTPSIEFTNESVYTAVDYSKVNTECSGESSVTVLIPPEKSVSITFVNSIVWERIQNQ